MNPHYIKVKDCFDYLSRVNSLNRRAWIFRGHSISCDNSGDENDPTKNLKLISSGHRFLIEHKKMIRSQSWYPREHDHIRRFKSTAKGFLQNYPEDDDTISWLGLMQHYGYPTRLLDFTFNPAVALYFALENASQTNGFAGVHALYIDSIRRHSMGVLHSTFNNPPLADYLIGEDGQLNEFLGISCGDWTNERQEAQEGVFLVPSKIVFNVEKWISSINISKKLKEP